MDNRTRVFSTHKNQTSTGSSDLSIVYYYLLAGVTLLVSVALFLPRSANI